MNDLTLHSEPVGGEGRISVATREGRPILVSLPTPAGWETVRSAEGAPGVVGPAVGGFRPNILIYVSRVADGADLDSVVTVMEAAAPREVAGYTFESERAVEADGVPAVLWTGSVPSPVGDGRLVESHLVTDPASTNGVIVHLLATTPSDTPDGCARRHRGRDERRRPGHDPRGGGVSAPDIHLDVDELIVLTRITGTRPFLLPQEPVDEQPDRAMRSAVRSLLGRGLVWVADDRVEVDPVAAAAIAALASPAMVAAADVHGARTFTEWWCGDDEVLCVRMDGPYLTVGPADPGAGVRDLLARRARALVGEGGPAGGADPHADARIERAVSVVVQLRDGEVIDHREETILVAADGCLFTADDAATPSGDATSSEAGDAGGGHGVDVEEIIDIDAVITRLLSPG